jgi:cytochrome oxidase assembly protein ShyY1
MMPMPPSSKIFLVISTLVVPVLVLLLGIWQTERGAE